MLSTYSMVYSMPAQPPFFTPTRSPATGRSDFAISSLIRVAAASERRITWGLGLAVAILRLLSLRQNAKPLQNTNNSNKHNHFHPICRLPEGVAQLTTC